MDSKTVSHPRPLSPHLGIYRFKLHMAMSIFHRITGCALAFSTPVLVAWIWSLAYSPEWFVCISDFLKTIIGQLMLIGWTFAFFYHLGNGVRHLFWDTGRGFQLETVTKSGVSVILFAVIFTAVTWGCLYYRMAGVQ
jgi:succinate dehydrogenase / fumarate reductase cytochrome b subunit